MSGDGNECNSVRTLVNHARWHNEPHIVRCGALVFLQVLLTEVIGWVGGIHWDIWKVGPHELLDYTGPSLRRVTPGLSCDPQETNLGADNQPTLWAVSS